MEEIYHLAFEENMGIILRDGLKSRGQLIRDGVWWKQDSPVNDFEQWRYDCVYFGLGTPGEGVNWFSLLVDPYETLVGNQYLEYSYDAYKRSIMTLAEYLRKQDLDRGEYSHPLTAERSDKMTEIVVPDSLGLARWGAMRTGMGKMNDYRPEVFIETDIIPANRIHRYNRARS